MHSVSTTSPRVACAYNVSVKVCYFPYSALAGPVLEFSLAHESDDFDSLPRPFGGSNLVTTPKRRFVACSEKEET